MIHPLNQSLLLYSLFVFFVICIFFKPLSGHLESKWNADKVEMQKAIRNMLDWKSIPSEKSKFSTAGSPVKSTEVTFMRQLFDHSSGQNVAGSTVRSFKPIITSPPRCEGLNGLLFQLNSLKLRDLLLTAEVHFDNWQKLSKYKLAGSKQIQATRQYQLGSIKNCKEESIHTTELTASSKQWISFDVKKSVDQMRKMNSTQLFFRVLQNSRPLSLKQLARLLRHHSPFLTISSKSIISSIEPATEEQETNTRSKRNVGFQLSEPLNNQQRWYRSRKNARQVSTPYYYSYQLRDNQGEIKGYTKKTLAASRQLKAQFQTFETTVPKMLTARKQKHKSRRPKTRYNPTDPMKGFGRMDTDFVKTTQSSLLPFPTQLKSEETLDAVREFNVNTGEKSQTNDVTLMLLDQEKEKKCQKHSLQINFRDIGWDKWIIAPESFEAGYCDGSCSYPLDKESNPSNHAILQSILKASSNQYSHLPQACCVPDAMDSLTLLYYDENENVVLKNYPKMLITSCSCV